MSRLWCFALAALSLGAALPQEVLPPVLTPLGHRLRFLFSSSVLLRRPSFPEPGIFGCATSNFSPSSASGSSFDLDWGWRDGLGLGSAIPGPGEGPV